MFVVSQAMNYLLHDPHGNPAEPGSAGPPSWSQGNPWTIRLMTAGRFFLGHEVETLV
jgi:hypothetical protein